MRITGWSLVGWLPHMSQLFLHCKRSLFIASPTTLLYCKLFAIVVNTDTNIFMHVVFYFSGSSSYQYIPGNGIPERKDHNLFIAFALLSPLSSKRIVQIFSTTGNQMADGVHFSSLCIEHQCKTKHCTWNIKWPSVIKKKANTDIGPCLGYYKDAWQGSCIRKNVGGGAVL